MRGWRSYFGFCETPEVLVVLTRWVRLRLRAALWRQWKTPRRRRAALLLELGVYPRPVRVWLAAGAALEHFARAKALAWAFECLLQIAWASVIVRGVLAQPTRTAVYGPVCTVVWQGVRVGDRRPYADHVEITQLTGP